MKSELEWIPIGIMGVLFILGWVVVQRGGRGDR